MNLYFKIRKFLQPWWNPVPKELKELRKSQGIEPIEKSEPRKLKLNKQKKKSTVVRSFENGLPVIRVTQSPVSLVAGGKLPEYNTIWGFHNATTHETVVRLKHDTNNPPGYRFTERSDKNRKKLKPLLYPIINEPYDRTHTVVYGVSGLEADPYCLVGWDSHQNRKDFNQFEQNGKKLTKTNDIIWITQIKKLQYGARWTYVILEEHSGNQLMSNTWEFGTPQKPVKFWWAN